MTNLLADFAQALYFFFKGEFAINLLYINKRNNFEIYFPRKDYGWILICYTFVNG